MMWGERPGTDRTPAGAHERPKPHGEGEPAKSSPPPRASTLLIATCLCLTAHACGSNDSQTMTDRTRRDILVRRAQAMTGAGAPMVPMSDFLDGNEDVGSIAPNLTRHPGLTRFRDVFERIERRPDVRGVWAQMELEFETYPDDEWPFASTVVVITTATPTDVDAWVAELQADPCSEMDAAEVACIGPVPPDHRVVAVWWD